MSQVTLFLITSAVFFSIGILIGVRYRPRPSNSEIARYMRRVTNAEEQEARERRMRAQMTAARRSSVPRAKSAGPAKIRKVRFSPPRDFR